MVDDSIDSILISDDLSQHTNPIFVHVTKFFLIILSTQEFPSTGPHFQTESYNFTWNRHNLTSQCNCTR